MAFRKGRETVPAKPFADWLNQRIAYWEKRLNTRGSDGSSARGPLMMLLDEIGWADADNPRAYETAVRRLYRYRHLRSETKTGSKRTGRKDVVKPLHVVPRDMVEEVLHHAGVQFSDLYPEIAAAEDLALEPEAWCPGCQDIVIPINGVCAWCEWRVSKPTGQVLQGRRLAA